MYQKRQKYTKKTSRKRMSSGGLPQCTRIIKHETSRYELYLNYLLSSTYFLVTTKYDQV